MCFVIGRLLQNPPGLQLLSVVSRPPPLTHPLLEAEVSFLKSSPLAATMVTYRLVFYIYLFIVGEVHMLGTACLEIRRQLWGVGFRLPSYSFWGPSSDPYARLQVIFTG